MAEHLQPQDIRETIKVKQHSLVLIKAIAKHEMTQTTLDKTQNLPKTMGATNKYM